MSRGEKDSPSNPSATVDSVIDVNDGYAVLDFTYRFLAARELAPSDAEVRAVTAALAQYTGAPLVTAEALEEFLCDFDEQFSGRALH